MIKEGDIFKMGRISIKVRELSINERSSSNHDGVLVLTDRELEINDTGDNKSLSEKLCRICFRTDDCVEDPLFTPCKCAGSMRYIHFNCLKEWLKNKLVTKETNYSYSFTLKNLECELCKTPLQGKFCSELRTIYFQRQKLQFFALSQVRASLHDLRHPEERVKEDQR